nr:MAG TPA: hypothetical protein [Bacteriophage sp.]
MSSKYMQNTLFLRKTLDKTPRNHGIIKQRIYYQ